MFGKFSQYLLVNPNRFCRVGIKVIKSLVFMDMPEVIRCNGAQRRKQTYSSTFYLPFRGHSLMTSAFFWPNYPASLKISYFEPLTEQKKEYLGLLHDLNHLLNFFSHPKYNFVLATSGNPILFHRASLVFYQSPI